jgi:hypothetical protein
MTQEMLVNQSSDAKMIQEMLVNQSSDAKMIQDALVLARIFIFFVTFILIRSRSLVSYTAVLA